MARTDQHAPTLVIVLSGEIDLANASEIGDRIIAAMDRDDGRTVVVDCANVAFMDSRGIAMLVRVQRTFSAAERAVIWRGFAEPIVKILRLVGVYDYLTIAE